MNLTLGSGKAVHIAHVTPGFMPSPECGGNRGVERYRETAREATCKKCLKWLAQQAQAETEAAEYSVPAEADIAEAIETGSREELEDARAWLLARLAEVDAQLAELSTLAEKKPVKVHLDHCSDDTAIALMTGGHGFEDDPQLYISRSRAMDDWEGCDDYDGRNLWVTGTTLMDCVNQWIKLVGLDHWTVLVEFSREY